MTPEHFVVVYAVVAAVVLTTTAAWWTVGQNDTRADDFGALFLIALLWPLFAPLMVGLVIGEMINLARGHRP